MMMMMFVVGFSFEQNKKTKNTDFFACMLLLLFRYFLLVLFEGLVAFVDVIRRACLGLLLCRLLR